MEDRSQLVAVGLVNGHAIPVTSNQFYIFYCLTANTRGGGGSSQLYVILASIISPVFKCALEKEC